MRDSKYPWRVWRYSRSLDRDVVVAMMETEAAARELARALNISSDVNAKGVGRFGAELYYVDSPAILRGMPIGMDSELNAEAKFDQQAFKRGIG
jgi:hypothetical protein